VHSNASKENELHRTHTAAADAKFDCIKGQTGGKCLINFDSLAVKLMQSHDSGTFPIDTAQIKVQEAEKK
jgi:hypothetical protein